MCVEPIDAADINTSLLLHFTGEAADLPVYPITAGDHDKHH